MTFATCGQPWWFAWRLSGCRSVYPTDASCSLAETPLGAKTDTLDAAAFFDSSEREAEIASRHST